MTRPMDPLFDERIAEWLGGEPDTAPGEALEVVLTTFPSVPQQRVAHRVPRRLPTMPTPIRFAAAAVIGVLAIGGALYVTRPGQPAVAGPGPTASARASSSLHAVVAPSATPTATPSPTPTPILWTEASLKEDWPAPVRPEPAGGSSVLPMPLTHMDPTGDTRSDVDPWVDIRAVMGNTSNVKLKLASNYPPVVNPTEQWIAYGVVTDDDRDGVPDWRYGIDNMPVEPSNPNCDHFSCRTRVWRTDLHTGRTDDQGFFGYGTAWGQAWPDGAGADFTFGGTVDVTGGGTSTWGIELDMPFYTWASVIVNGRVVATDYAPDAGWLIATPGAKPGGTYLLEDLFPLDLSMSVPEGWTAYGSSLNYDGPGDEEIGLDFDIAGVGHTDNGWSCDASGGAVEAQFGPTVDDLVTFLAGVQTIKISENTDVTLDGYRGKYLEITPATTADCGVVPGFTRAWIVDVDGVRLAIGASSISASETAMAELRQIVNSIQIEP